mmetsp:Transcript_179/g.216  ORF Transcript_179/g.216 Transcript_179/m.216 type:complete len:232 (-) Transcript_179:1506-2201(-)
MEEKRQTIVFMRHGVAQHNVLDKDGRPPSLKDPEMFDPPLVAEGKCQVLDAGERLRIWWHTTQMGEQIELVICSPLTRCLQTAALALLPGERYFRGFAEPTFCCMELIREAYGMSYPDRRRTKELLTNSWPQIHFDPQMPNDDEAWKLDERESIPDVIQRVNFFLQWLIQREETNIVVISHGVWIECCLHAHCPQALQQGDRVHNADLFAGECVSVGGQFRGLENVRRLES